MLFLAFALPSHAFVLRGALREQGLYLQHHQLPPFTWVRPLIFPLFPLEVLVSMSAFNILTPNFKLYDTETSRCHYGNKKLVLYLTVFFCWVSFFLKKRKKLHTLIFPQPLTGYLVFK